MGDVVRDLTHAGHERLDAFQHPIEPFGEPVEVVAAAAQGDTPRQIALHDLAAGQVDRLQTPCQARPHQPGAREGQGQRDRQPPGQGIQDQITGRLQIADIAPDQQHQTTAQQKDLSARLVLVGVIRAPFAQPETNPAVGIGRFGRPAIQIADDALEALVDQQIDARPDRIARHPFADERCQTNQPTAAILLGQTTDLGLDGLCGLTIHVTGGGPVDKAKQDTQRAGKQQHIEQRQPKDGTTCHARHARAQTPDQGRDPHPACNR